MNLYGPTQLIESFRAVRRNTIVIAEDIPEDEYDYRPSPESRSVAETLVHIAFTSQADRQLHGDNRLSSLKGFSFGELIKQSEEKQLRSKSEIVALLRSEGERWCDWVAGLREAVLAEQVVTPGGGLKDSLRDAARNERARNAPSCAAHGDRAPAWHRATPNSQSAARA